MAIIGPNDLPVVLKVRSDPMKKYALAQLGFGGVDVEITEDQFETAIRLTGDFIAGYLKDKTRELTIWIIKLIAGYVFDCIIFPLGLFLLLFWLTKATAKYLFDVKQRQTLRDDLEEIFKKYRSFHY